MGWTLVERTPTQVALTRDGASLLLDLAPPGPPGSPDDDLGAAIACLAPHLAFGPPVRTGDRVERVHVAADHRVTIGRLSRGPARVVYMLAAREPIDIADIVATHLGAASSPFDHLAD